MPWQEVSAMSLRAEFVALANQDRANVRALCRQFQISPPGAYKWLASVAVSGTSIAWTVGNASGQTLVEQNLAP